jgi:hypothetical protein
MKADKEEIMQGGLTMRSTKVLITVGLVALVAVFAGCSDDGSNVVDSNNLTLDQQAVADLINLSSEFQHDVTSHVVPDTTATTVRSGAAVVEGRFWWRTYSSVNRQLTIDTYPADSLNTYDYADVSIVSTYGGTFHVVHRDTLGVYSHSTQAISDVFTQNGRFEQWFSEATANRGWVRTELSNIVGGSNPSALDIQVLSIDAETSTDKFYTAADFATLYPTASKLTLDESEQINLMAQSGLGTNRLFRHDWATGTASREELTNQDLGFYSNTHITPTALTSAQSQRLLVLDVIAPGVIESGATYDALIWAVPYAVNIGGTPQ